MTRNPKRWAKRIGLDSIWHTIAVQSRLLGERAQFAVRGRPAPSAAIVLASSGRSGSTWLADMICAVPGIQQIFEPLHPEASATYRRLIGWTDNGGAAYLRPYLRPGIDRPDWRHFLADALSGRVRNHRTDAVRTAFFPRRFLVKEIRANLLLGFLYDAFQPQIVLLARHPCAVVHSRLHRVRDPWYADVSDILAQEELVEDHLRPWVKDIERERDLLGAHAVWWAVENRVAMSDLSTRPHQLVFYETLCLQPEAEMRRLFAWLHLPTIDLPPELIARPSRVTTDRQTIATRQDVIARFSGWRHALSATDQKRILTWAERLEIPWYSADALPVES